MLWYKHQEIAFQTFLPLTAWQTDICKARIVWCRMTWSTFEDIPVTKKKWIESEKMNLNRYGIFVIVEQRWITCLIIQRSYAFCSHFSQRCNFKHVPLGGTTLMIFFKMNALLWSLKTILKDYKFVKRNQTISCWFGQRIDN